MHVRGGNMASKAQRSQYNHTLTSIYMLKLNHALKCFDSFGPKPIEERNWVVDGTAQMLKAKYVLRCFDEWGPNGRSEKLPAMNSSERAQLVRFIAAIFQLGLNWNTWQWPLSTCGGFLDCKDYWPGPIGQHPCWLRNSSTVTSSGSDNPLSVVYLGSQVKN